ncbi:MAG: winged helix-turn-helix domain-containing protein, partial [Vicinamibacterales bacterium]
MKAPTFRFGDICVDIERVAVTRAGASVDLEPKAFDVLRTLLEHRDRLVTKDELLNAVWPDTFVTPNVLTRAIAQLRKALGDDAVEAKYIQTVTKRGYRFIVHVTVDAEAPATVSSSPRFWSARLVAGFVVVAALSLMAGVWMTRPAGDRPPGTATEPIQTRRLTLRAGNNAEPTLSPDGAMVAFSGDTTGAFEIYVAGVTLGSREIALTHDGGQNIQPAWSPNGKWIAFHSRARGGVWLIPATGGSPTQIVEVGSQPDWSPDSEWIAFTTSQGAMAAHSNLRVVRRDGTGLRDLTQVGTPLGGQRQPKWSRSGRFVAFTVSNGSGSNRAWVVDTAGGTPRELPSVGWTDFIAFGPDDRMLYLTGRSPDRLAIYGLTLNPSTLTPEGEPVVVTQVTMGNMAGLSVSRTNTVAYAVRTTDANLWAVDTATGSSPGEPVPLTRNTTRVTGP